MSSRTAELFDELCVLVAARRRDDARPGILLGQLGDCHALARLLSGQDEHDEDRVRQLASRLGLDIDVVLRLMT